jgi:acyl dehydratase
MAEDDERYFEDLTVGDRTDCGTLEVTRDEMLEFAERDDPEPFHVDQDAQRRRWTATSSPVGGWSAG